MTKSTFDTDFDGIVLEVEHGVALTIQPSNGLMQTG